MIVFGTIAASIACWAIAAVIRAIPQATRGTRVPRVEFQARVAWTAAVVLMVVHSIAAFGWFYGWSHDIAYAATAQQTAAIAGFNWGGGIFVNYAFLLVWTLDAAWWWVAPRSYEARSGAVSAFVHGFVFFMFLNGAIVFADGWMRVLGILAVSTVGLMWLIKLSRRGQAA